MLSKIQKQEIEMLEFMKSRGYEVQYSHAMPGTDKEYHCLPYTNIDKGRERGFTVAYLYDLLQMREWRIAGYKIPKPAPVAECVAYCSANDQFDKKKGRIIALARLMKKKGLTELYREWRKMR